MPLIENISHNGMWPAIDGRLASLRHLGNRFNLAGFHRFSDSTEYAYPFRTEFIWDYTDITSTLLEDKDSFTQKC